MIWLDVIVLIITIVCVAGLICATILRSRYIRKKNKKDGCSGCGCCGCGGCPFYNKEEK